MHEDAEIASISSEEAKDDNFSVDILLREDETLFSCVDELISEFGQIISYATTSVDDENGLSSEDRHSSDIIDDENELSSEDRHSCGITDDEEELSSEDRDSSRIIDDIIYNIQNLEVVTSSMDIPEALHDFVKQPLHMWSIYHRQ